jgi:hypothetical protein
MVASGFFLLLLIPERFRDALFLAGVVFCCVLAFFDFAGIWRFFLLILPVGHLVGSMFGLRSVSLTRLVLIGMTAVLLVLHRKNAGRWSILPLQPAVLAFSVFVAANLISAIHAFQPESVFRTLTYLEPLLFFILSYHVVRRDSVNFRHLLRAVALGGVVVVVIAFVEMRLQRPAIDVLGIHLPGFVEDLSVYFQENRFGLGGRISSTIGQPVLAGIYFVMWAVVCVSYVLTYRPRTRAALVLLVPIAGILILATGARAPLIALPLSLVAVAFVTRSKGKAVVKVGLGAAVLAVAINLAAPTMLGYLRESLSTNEDSIAAANLISRLDLTSRLMGIFWEHPVFGYGPGLIQKAALQGSLDFVGLGGLENQYAVILADGGILAGAAYLLFVVATLWSLLRLRSTTSREVLRGALLVFLLFMFYLVVTASVTSLTNLPMYIVMTLFGGLAARAANDRYARLNTE